MKKIRNLILFLLFIGILIGGYLWFHSDNRYFVENDLYENYVAENKYEGMYLVENYVDERMNASSILRASMIAAMNEYDSAITSERNWKSYIDIGLKILKTQGSYRSFTQQNQYVESDTVSLEYVGDQYDHNYEYTGYLEDGTEVTGNVAIWGTEGDVSIAVSFQDGNGNIDSNKAKLFTDDSNSEMLAYLLIEAVQNYLGTNYEPNEAAMTFFNSSIETVAGSISYHAAMSLLSTETHVGEIATERVQTANISTIDEDGFLVNQSY